MKRINWKLRLKNKATLASIIGLVVSTGYQILGILEIVPPISESTVETVAGLLLNGLLAIGVLVDPTTAGIGDSTQALNYTEPRRGESDGKDD